MMTKKQYKRIAEMIERYSPYSDQIGLLAGDLADYFKEDNPNFKEDRFLKACGGLK